MTTTTTTMTMTTAMQQSARPPPSPTSRKDLLSPQVPATPGTAASTPDRSNVSNNSNSNHNNSSSSHHQSDHHRRRSNHPRNPHPRRRGRRRRSSSHNTSTNNSTNAGRSDVNGSMTTSASCLLSFSTSFGRNKVQVSQNVYLDGQELEQYCQQRGLCPLCAQTKVRKRVFHLFSKNQWRPLTQQLDQRANGSGNFNGGGGNEYLVYQGYCVRDGCFTLTQARRLASSASQQGNSGRGWGDSNHSHKVNKTSGSPEMALPQQQQQQQQLQQQQLQIKSSSSKGNNSLLRRRGRRQNSKKKHTEAAEPGLSYSETNNHLNDEHDPPPPVQHIATPPPSPPCLPAKIARGTTTTTMKTFPSPEVKQQLVTAAATTTTTTTTTQTLLEGLHQLDVTGNIIGILDLSHVALSIQDISALVTALKSNTATTTTIHTLRLEHCQLEDSHLQILGQGLVVKELSQTQLPHLRHLSLANNEIGDDGIRQGLKEFLELSGSLEVLDLSRNVLGTLGGVAVFQAFARQQRQRQQQQQRGTTNNDHGRATTATATQIRIIDLSHNELWDLEPPTSSDDDDEESAPTLPLSSSSSSSSFSSSGIQDFLAHNRTLRELRLEDNYLHDESLEAICAGLDVNAEHTALQKLHLGWNSIGDDGALALAECLVHNTSLKFVDVTENAIANPGGRALLAALDHNVTLEDIAGLWRNKMDRRYIIVAIRRLLLSTDRGVCSTSPTLLPPSTGTATALVENDDEEYDFADDVSDLSEEPLDDTQIVENNDHEGGRSALDREWSKREIHKARDMEKDRNVTSLELIPSPEKRSQRKLVVVDVTAIPVVEPLLETNLREEINNFDRITFFQSSPLVYFEKELGIHRGIPYQDYKSEALLVEEAVAQGAIATGLSIEVHVETATMDRFGAFFAEKDSHVMHFSCFGSPNALALENGYGSLQTLPVEGLRRLVAAVGSRLSFVFVSSCHARMIGEAFVEAGIPHVVCCQRDDTSFRDAVTAEFTQVFYTATARRMPLDDAFEAAVEAVVHSPLTAKLLNVKDRFHLLPAMPDIDDYHTTPVFFNQPVPPKKDADADFFEGFDHLPALPTNFIGREIDVWEIVEALRVDDIVKVTGTPGYGKRSIVAAATEYVMRRRTSYNVDDIFWLPAPGGVAPEHDSLYGDLCLCCNLLRTSQEDEWDTHDLILECKERLEIELEELRIVLVVDDRSFSSKGSQDALEKFISFILNVATAKVILITTRGNESSSLLSNSTTGSRIEESIIEIDTLDFRSTALLFGRNCKFITEGSCPLAMSPKEFADLVEPPFVSRMPDPSVVSSQRRTKLYTLMGSGLPSAVIAAAENMDKTEFTEIIKISKVPEMYVDSLNEVEGELRRRTSQKEIAIRDKNYARAMDLAHLIEELEGMRSEFPTLKDLKEEERVMKSELADAVANRRYDTANDMKRDLLMLKKKIMKERRLLPEHAEKQKEKLGEFQAQVESLIEEAGDSFRMEDLERTVSFSLNYDDEARGCCRLSVSYGDIYEFRHSTEAKGIVCWTNEACELATTQEGCQLLEEGGESLRKDISSLPATENRHGVARCATGNAVLLGPSLKYGKLSVPVLILTVGPFSPGSQSDALLEADEDYLHYSEIMLRSCYRSSLVVVRRTELKALGVSLLTTRKKGPIYRQLLRLGLMTLLDEAKFTMLTDLHIIAKTPKEASLVVSFMEEMGHRPIHS